MLWQVDSVTLAFQQSTVLRNNLDQQVAHFYGAMGTDHWSEQTWREHFNNNMVIVCTAEILNQCLLNAFIKMEQINLLVFDEAHHTKKEHAYARLVLTESYEQHYGLTPQQHYQRFIPQSTPRQSPENLRNDCIADRHKR